MFGMWVVDVVVGKVFVVVFGDGELEFGSFLVEDFFQVYVYVQGELVGVVFCFVVVIVVVEVGCCFVDVFQFEVVVFFQQFGVFVVLVVEYLF